MTNGSANYYNGGYVIGDPYYRTEVGAYDAKPSDSPYGTFDQGGNVFEWNEAILYFVSRGLRGGAYDYNDIDLHAADRNDCRYPTHESHHLGFRVAYVPEPATLGLLLLGGSALLRRKRSPWRDNRLQIFC